MKIGFVGNLYGTPKGHSYVVQDMVKAVLGAGHEAHMFRIGDNPLLPEFVEPTSLKSNVDREIPQEDFEKWLEEVQPEWCIFMEYAQWWDESHDKLQICKDRGVKTAGFLVYEKLNWDKRDHYKLYTKIICPTDFQFKLLRKHGIYNGVYVPWGVDIEAIDKIGEPPREDGKVRFLHCAGTGGVGNRKNTDKVIEAYKMMRGEDTDLVITHLNLKTFSKDEIIAFMKYSDVIINTSKWDTIGLSTLEANACGKPVLVCNTAPMTELVKNRMNGILVDGVETTVEHVTCPAYDVDAKELAKQMSILRNRLILDTMKSASRKYALANFDWSKNKEHFLKVFS